MVECYFTICVQRKRLVKVLFEKSAVGVSFVVGYKVESNWEPGC